MRKSKLQFKTLSFFILIFAFLIFAAGVARASKTDIPDQLFDINLTINDSTVSSIDELSANAVFVSFGKVPTPVEATFTILNSAGNQVHIESDSIVVETELVLNKQFKGLGLKEGKYTLVLSTLYNNSVKDEFRKEFEVAKGVGIDFWIPRFWILIVILTVIASWFLYHAMKPVSEQAPMSSVIRVIEDGRIVNSIMMINRFVVLTIAFLFIYSTWALNIIRFNPLTALFFIIPAIAAANGIWFWYSRARKPDRFYFHLQVLIDAALILAVVYYTGGLYSDFLFLPLIVLSLAALVSLELSSATFIVSAGFYFFMFFYQTWGLSLEEIFQSLGGLNGMKFIRILIFIFMGVLISFTISYFIKEIKRRSKEVEDAKREVYGKVVRGLCDPLTAARLLLEEFDKKEFVSRNPELAKDIDLARQLEKVASEVVKKSMASVHNDFLPTNNKESRI